MTDLADHFATAAAFDGNPIDMAQAAPPARVIDGIYEAALDSSLWPDAVAEISGSFDGLPVAVLVNDARTGDVPLFVTAKLEPWSIERFKADFSTTDRNPLLVPAMTAREGKAFRFPELLGDRFTKSAVYNDIIRPLGVKNYLSVVAARTDSIFVGFELFSRPGYRPPAENEIVRFESTARHLRRAFRLSGSLGGTSTRLRDLEGALDWLDDGVFLLDRTGRLSWRNKAATELLDRRDGLFLRQGRLAASRPGDDRVLLNALGRAVDATVRIARPSGGRAFILDLHRLWNSLASPGASFAVFVSDPDADHLTAARVARTFDLTDAEARAALAVSRSHGVADAAAKLGLSPNTVKTTLQRVFAKTGTHSQAELVRLLVSSLGHSRSTRRLT